MKGNSTKNNVTTNVSSTIDDLQFRRSIYAEPSSQDSAIIEAQTVDPSKKKLAQELNAFDKQIKQAMHVPVPDDLCNKILLSQTLVSHQQAKKKSRFYLAIAASVAIMAGVVVNYLQFSSNYSNLGDYALAHIYHEQNAFSNSDSTRISLTSLNSKMTTFNGSFNQAIGELISADYCRFGGIKSLHLVFKGATDIVTVFVVPKEEHLSVVNKFNDAQLQGESLSFKHANVIVVANQNESLNKWQTVIKNNINWLTS